MLEEDGKGAEGTVETADNESGAEAKTDAVVAAEVAAKAEAVGEAEVETETVAAEEVPAWAQQLQKDVQSVREQMSETPEEAQVEEPDNTQADALKNFLAPVEGESDEIKNLKAGLGQLFRSASDQKLARERTTAIKNAQTEALKVAAEMKADFPDIIDDKGNVAKKYQDCLVDLYGLPNGQGGWDVEPASVGDRMRAAMYYKYGKPGTKPPVVKGLPGDNPKARIESSNSGTAQGAEWSPADAQTNEELIAQVEARQKKEKR